VEGSRMKRWIKGTLIIFGVAIFIGVFLLPSNETLSPFEMGQATFNIALVISVVWWVYCFITRNRHQKDKDEILDK